MAAAILGLRGLPRLARSKFAVPAIIALRGYKVQASDIRTNNVIEVKNKLYSVMKATFVKTAMRRAQITMELRDLKSGNKTKEIFRSTDDVEVVDIDHIKCQFQYREKNKLFLMRSDTYEQVEINSALVNGGDDSALFLTEGMEVTVDYHDTKPLSLSLPEQGKYIVAETTDIVKGASNSSSKPAKLDIGVLVNVPPYVAKGDAVVISIADKRFLSRSAKSTE